MPVEEYFRDKVCVVTGAASGIGYALSEALLRLGATVFMADRDTKTLASSVGQLADHAGRVHPVNVDVTKPDQVKRLIEEAASLRGIDFLFNNAGIGGTIPFGEVTLEHWRRIIDINLWGVIYGVHAAVPIMRRQGRGHIINTASIAGLIPFPYQALYCTSKFAVVGLSESLRFELADEGVHFSVVCPAEVATRIFGKPIIGQDIEVEPPKNAIPAEEAAQIILAGVSKKEGVIVLPESARKFWLQYRSSPESGDNLLADLARQRRNSYQATGSYY